uniref:Uncharacterized protein n=1 Tax=Callithrix jacchus TaxID=9483 RepID=A0A5F4WCB9_CALJA
LTASSTSQVHDLYRASSQISARFSSHNYKTYSFIKLRGTFRENNKQKDPV